MAAASTAQALLADQPTPENAAAVGQRAMAATSKIADGALKQPQGRTTACRSGCAHCCYQAVGVSAPEVFAIYEHLRATRPPAELAATARRIRETDDKTRGMHLSERLSPELPCPFLENEQCTIYDARPLVCRGKNSLDAAACERSLRDPAGRAAYLNGSLAVPCFVEPIRAAHAVAAGVQLALQELQGLQVAPLELTAAMRVLLDDPEGVTSQWLSGRDPFASARGGDVTDDPRIRKLVGAR